MAGPGPVAVYVEAGAKRAFAGGLAWPGWCRGGRDEAAALAALVAYAPRYAEVIGGVRPAFGAPGSAAGLQVVERVRGDATTDFGAPAVAPESDGRPIGAAELRRLSTILTACWVAFDEAVDRVGRRRLTPGPRGGGRNVDAIVGHVVGAETGYLRRLAAKALPVDEGHPRAHVGEVREAVLEAVTGAVRDGLPNAGPRGGKIWLPRYFVRRVAWHALDHAWEIEDRSA